MYSVVAGSCRRLTSFQHQGRTGYIIQGVHTCAAEHYRLESHSSSISPRTIQPCQVGLRGWKWLFRNVDYGQRQGCLHSARTSNVQSIAQTAVVSVCFLLSLISLLKNPSFKNLSSHMATSATSMVLPKVPLQAQFHWAILGCSEASISCCSPSKHPQGHGSNGEGVPWWYLHSTDLAVSFIVLPVMPQLNKSSRLRTDQHVSLPLMGRVYQGHRQLGLTKNIMDIAHCLRNGFLQLEIQQMCRYSSKI